MVSGKRVQVCLISLAILLSNVIFAFSMGGGTNKSNVKTRIAEAYLQHFGLEIPSPAYVRSRVQGNNYRYTSTAYLGNLRYRVYLQDDGTIQANVCEVRRPLGVYRVAVVAIDHGNTNISALINSLWVESQQEINANYEEFSLSQGYAQSVVRFVNTNFLASGSDIVNPRNKEEVIAFVESRGYRREDFEVFVALDLDAENPSGGFTSFGGNFVYQGYYFSRTDFADLSRRSGHGKSRLYWIAKSVYDHECGHIFGWEHEWTPQSNNYDSESFITDPILYGWMDTDGDTVPEIIDLSPYGMETAVP